MTQEAHLSSALAVHLISDLRGCRAACLQSCLLDGPLVKNTVLSSSPVSGPITFCSWLRSLYRPWAWFITCPVWGCWWTCTAQGYLNSVFQNTLGIWGPSLVSRCHISCRLRGEFLKWNTGFFLMLEASASLGLKQPGPLNTKQQLPAICLHL